VLNCGIQTSSFAPGCDPGSGGGDEGNPAKAARQRLRRPFALSAVTYSAAPAAALDGALRPLIEAIAAAPLEEAEAKLAALAGTKPTSIRLETLET
jgi:hypothetical protein